LALSAQGAALVPAHDTISLGVGGRCWHLQSKGSAHFEDVGGFAQPLDFKANLYGVFVQGSYRFGAF
jgi:hypothetical protein